jgi:hypothetical protein
LKSGILDRRQHSYNLDLTEGLQFAKEDKKNSCNFYFFFTYKTLAIHGNLDYKDFLLCSHFCKRETIRDSREGFKQRERERGAGGGMSEEREWQNLTLSYSFVFGGPV